MHYSWKYICYDNACILQYLDRISETTNGKLRKRKLKFKFNHMFHASSKKKVFMADFKMFCYRSQKREGFFKFKLTHFYFLNIHYAKKVR